MKDRIQLLIGDDGKATLYDDTYDIIIHCESEEEQAAVIAKLKSKGWIPVSERLPEKDGEYLCDYNGHIHIGQVINKHFRHYGEIADHLIIAWMPMPEPYKGGDDDE